MLSDLGKLQEGSSFSICPENFTGEKGGACRAQTGTGAHFSRDIRCHPVL